MTVRAKFHVFEKTENTWSKGIKLEPVVSGSPENEKFYATTPTGVLHIQTKNDEAAAMFEVGKQYYIDITPAN
jgi:hypothetical protein